MTNVNSVGSRIKMRRLDLSLTLEEVAQAVGVKKSTIQRYESGVIKNIGSKKINELANILQTSPEYLLEFKPFVQRKKFEDYVKRFYGDSLLEIVDNWYLLNDDGKHEAIKRVEELTEIPRYRDEDYIKSMTYNRENEV